MKSFVSALAKKFRISPTGSRAAVILYSDQAVKEIDFTSYTNSEDFRNAVDGLSQQRGRTRIDKALGLAYRDFFGPGGSARPDVQRITVVLTDGQQTPDPDAVELDVASERLRKGNVYILAVGIGHRIDKRELRLMTERDQDVYLADSFDDLLNRVGAFAQTACKGMLTASKYIKISTSMAG
jgi:secreted protein with Ig-like and vWFA domain